MVLIVRSEWRGRGCSHSCSMGGSWEVSQACSHRVGGGLPVQRVRRQLSIALHSQYSQVNVTYATRDNHHWVRNSTLPLAYSSCPPPCWPAALVGRAPAPPFFRQPPLSLPRSHNQCKGCSRDLRWFLTSPPQTLNREVTSISLPHVAH